MKKYFFLTLLFWSIYIILNAVMDSMVFHVNHWWYWNLTAWHIIKPFSILALFITGWYGAKLQISIFQKYEFGFHYKIAERKKRLRYILTIAFFAFYGLLWRWVWFEHLIDKFAGRL